MAKPESIAAYIRNESVPIQKALIRMRLLISKAAPQATEKLAWGMPTFYLEGNLLHFAAFKSHMSLFPGTDAVKHFKKDLVRYRTSKGTIQIPYEDSIPATLVTKIVRFCVMRNLADAKKKAKTKVRHKKPR